MSGTNKIESKVIVSKNGTTNRLAPIVFFQFHLLQDFGDQTVSYAMSTTGQ